MAGADYYKCDKCGGKTFYDANLNWDFSDDEGDTKVRGKSYSLDCCGDIACLCVECSKTFQCIIVPIQENNMS